MEFPDFEPEEAKGISEGAAGTAAELASEAAQAAAEAAGKADSAEQRAEYERTVAEEQAKIKPAVETMLREASTAIEGSEPTDQTTGEVNDGLDAIEEDKRNGLTPVDIMESPTSEFNKKFKTMSEEARKSLTETSGSVFQSAWKSLSKLWRSSGIDMTKLTESEERTKKKVADAQDKFKKGPNNEQTRKTYQDAMDAAAEEHQAVIDEMLKENAKLKKLLEKQASKRSTTTQKLELLVKAIFVGAIIGGGIWGLLQLADEFTGCFIYANNTSAKLSCSDKYEDHKDQCNCGSVARGIVGLDEIKTACATAKDTTTPACRTGCLPVTVGGKPVASTCTDVPAGGVYYTYEDCSILCAFKKAADAVWHFAGDLPGELAGWVGKILKYIAIGIIAVLGLVILIAIVRFVWSHFVTKKSSGFSGRRRRVR